MELFVVVFPGAMFGLKCSRVGMLYAVGTVMWTCSLGCGCAVWEVELLVAAWTLHCKNPLFGLFTGIQFPGFGRRNETILETFFVVGF
jgi:hypothetical protein